MDSIFKQLQAAPPLITYAEEDARRTHELFITLSTLPRAPNLVRAAWARQRTVYRLYRQLSRAWRPCMLQPVGSDVWEITFGPMRMHVRIGDGHVRVGDTQVPVRKWRDVSGRLAQELTAAR